MTGVLTKHDVFVKKMLRTVTLKPFAIRLKGNQNYTLLMTKLALLLRAGFSVLLIICVTQLQARSQNYKVTIGPNRQSLHEIFKEIKKQTGLVVFYSDALLNDKEKMIINVTREPLAAVMDRIVSGKPLLYQIQENYIVISAKPPAIQESRPVALSEPPVTMLPLPPVVVSGKVIDEKTLEPIVGASIVIKGNKGGIVTDKQGNFSVKVNTGETIIISSIGFVAQEITIKEAANNMTINLKVSYESLKEVIATGFFNRRASSFTGATSTFTSEDILKTGSQNVIQSLRNLEPALQLIDNSIQGSNPNVLPNIQLRGQSGLPDLRGEYTTNPNLPLFVLDGFETTLQKVIDLDIYRVKSVTILKDASSKAIYGSKAANGVVVIETQRPQAGKLRMSYNSNVTLQAPDLNSYNLTNATEKLQVELAGGIYSSTNASAQFTLMQRYEENLRLLQSGVNTDWLSKPVRNAIGQRHSLRIEGGDQSFRYGVDLMYNNVAGVMKGSDRNTVTAAIDLTYRVNNFAFNNLLTITDNSANNSPWGNFSDYAAMNPYLPYQDNQGRILKIITTLSRPQGGGAPGAVANSAVYNPAYNSTLDSKNFTKYTDITNNFNVDWSLTRSLRMRGRFSITKQLNSSDLFLPADHTFFTTSEFTGTGVYRKGRYTKGNGDLTNYSGNLLLNYVKKIDKHYISFNGGWDISSAQTNLVSYTVEGFPNERLDNVILALQYQQNTRPTGNESTVRDLSGLISGNYSYDDKYLFDASYRATESSQFGSNNRWGQFWSTGIGWNIHNEKFFTARKIFDQLKLRASTGFTGSQGFNSYMSLATYTYYLDNTYNTGGNGAYLMSLANPDLQWQRKQDNNFGIDISVLRKLNVRFDYYVNITDGLITDITLPPSNGFSTYKANLGKVENRGFDLRMDYRIYYNSKTRNSLTAFATVSHNTNIIKEISNALKAWNSQQDAISSTTGTTTVGKRDSVGRPRVRFIEGQSLNAIWAVPSLGIDPATGKEIYVKKDGSVTYTWDPADQVAAGNSLPKYYGNFGFNLVHNGFNLNTSFRYQFGGQVYNQTLVDKVENADIYQNVDRRVLSQRWKAPGDVSFFKDIASTTRTQLSTRFIEDDNQVTLATISLTYDFERIKKIRDLGFTRLRAGFNTNDAFVLSSVRVERGTSYPFARTFQFTLQASF
jgi:TonB-linked SusC/RagA family outer membrane protein